MRRLIFGVALALHGVIHLLGFLVYWKVTEFDGLAYPATLLGGLVAPPDALVRVLGALWLAAATMFLIGTAGLVLRSGWWWKTLTAAATLSLALSVVAWPEAQFGFLLNVLVLAGLALQRGLATGAGRTAARPRRMGKEAAR